MSKREHPAWMYLFPDDRNKRIAEQYAEIVILRAALAASRARLAKYEKKKARK